MKILLSTEKRSWMCVQCTTSSLTNFSATLVTPNPDSANLQKKQITVKENHLYGYPFFLLPAHRLKVVVVSKQPAPQVYTIICIDTVPLREFQSLLSPLSEFVIVLFWNKPIFEHSPPLVLLLRCKLAQARVLQKNSQRKKKQKSVRLLSRLYLSTRNVLHNNKQGGNGTAVSKKSDKNWLS